MTDTLRQIAALEAQVDLMRFMLTTLRLSLSVQPTATIELPDRCKGIAPEQCGVQDVDARISKASFTKPDAWACPGCHMETDGGAAADGGSHGN